MKEILPYLGTCKECNKEFAYIGQTSPSPTKCPDCDPKNFTGIAHNYRPDWNDNDNSYILS